MRTVRPKSWSRLADGPPMARTVPDDPRLVRPGLTESTLNCGYTMERVTERVTGMNPHYQLGESEPSGAPMCRELQGRLSASDRKIPVLTGVNGTLMARRSWTTPAG